MGQLQGKVAIITGAGSGFGDWAAAILDQAGTVDGLTEKYCCPTLSRTIASMAASVMQAD
mgnify:CR=1 FL=1